MEPQVFGGLLDARPGRVDGKRSLVARAWAQLAKGPIFTVFAFFTVGGLLALGFKNHEPVSAAIAGVAMAFYGGSAWKNHSDQRYGNGYSLPGSQSSE